jgi:hypothetical protein
MLVATNKQLIVLRISSAFYLGFTKERFKKAAFSAQMYPRAK